MNARSSKIKSKKKTAPLKSAYILERVKEASNLRDKDREFHGLEREFLDYQEQILSDYNKTKPLKHPRDKGAARENILRKFLQDSGYIPQKYGISDKSARVISPSGHSSKEIDILIYDKENAITLMQRQSSYVAYPIECVYGVIQVKSILTKNEINSGLENISSFKSLSTMPSNSSNVVNGFGILFAYDSNMEWGNIVMEIKKYAQSNPNSMWCNAIFILNKGWFLHGDNGKGSCFNRDIVNFNDPLIYGIPDHSNICLYAFYNTLMKLLRSTRVQLTEIDNYFRLPLVAGNLSYKFSFGSFAEILSCDTHGKFQKKFSEGGLKKIIAQAKTSEPINWVKATEISLGHAGNNYESYKRQPGEVRIYNPDSLPLSDILVGDKIIDGKQIRGFVSYDAIDCAGMKIWIPFYYSCKENLLEFCPKCRPINPKTNNDI